MRCAIFYLAYSIPDRRYAADYWSVWDQSCNVRALVRMEIVEAADPSDALGMAQPGDGETVMNTHEVGDAH